VVADHRLVAVIHQMKAEFDGAKRTRGKFNASLTYTLQARVNEFLSGVF
jgi:hypothetical protein